MKTRKHHQSASTRGTGSLPFAGLGFDLESVELAANAVRIAPLTGNECRELRQPDYAIPGLAGFDLLVSLGREIRGR